MQQSMRPSNKKAVLKENINLNGEQILFVSFVFLQVWQSLEIIYTRK